VPRLVVVNSCLPKTSTITLHDAAGKSLAVQVVATHRGSKSVQYVIEPSTALVPGIYRIDVQTYVRDTHALHVVAAVNAAPPVLAAPKVKSQKQVEFGCGPAKSVVVGVGTSAPLAFVQLTDSKQQQSGFVPVRDGAISIGHGMCGGAFSLARGRSYTASITLLSPVHGTTSTSASVPFVYAP
jgi:hypothetical protein